MKSGTVVNIFQDGKYGRGRKGLVIENQGSRFKVLVPTYGNMEMWFYKGSRSNGGIWEAEEWNDFIFSADNPENYNRDYGGLYEEFLKTNDHKVSFDGDFDDEPCVW